MEDLREGREDRQSQPLVTKTAGTTTSPCSRHHVAACEHSAHGQQYRFRSNALYDSAEIPRRYHVANLFTDAYVFQSRWATLAIKEKGCNTSSSPLKPSGLGSPAAQNHCTSTTDPAAGFPLPCSKGMMPVQVLPQHGTSERIFTSIRLRDSATRWQGRDTREQSLSTPVTANQCMFAVCTGL